jgi:hypothetical protein
VPGAAGMSTAYHAVTAHAAIAQRTSATVLVESIDPRVVVTAGYADQANGAEKEFLPVLSKDSP